MNKIKFNINTKIKVIMILVFGIIAGLGVMFSITFSVNNNSFYGVELKDTTINNVKISDIKIKEENGITKYQANVKAIEEGNIKYIKILFKDSENKDIVTLVGYIGTTLKKDENKTIDASTDADLSQVKSVEYEVIK